MSNPFSIEWVLARHSIKVHGLQFFGDWATTTLTDNATIQRLNWQYFAAVPVKKVSSAT